MTVSQPEFLRDVANPELMLYLAELRGHMLEFAKLGPENRRIMIEPLCGSRTGTKRLLASKRP